MLRHGGCCVRCVFTVQDTEGGFMKNTDMNFSKRKRMSRARTPGYTANAFLPTKRRKTGYMKSAADENRKS